MADLFFVEIIFNQIFFAGEQCKFIFIYKVEKQALHMAVRTVALQNFLKISLNLIPHNPAMASALVFHEDSIPNAKINLLFYKKLDTISLEIVESTNLKEDTVSAFITIDKTNRGQYAELLQSMFRLRARVFSQKLGWKVSVNGAGEERDKYDDDLEVVYLLEAEEENGQPTHVISFLRLLSTARPTLLYDEFGKLVPPYAREALMGDDVWDCSRFCVDATRTTKAIRTSSLLLIALGELAVKHSAKLVIGIFTPAMLKIYGFAGCEVKTLSTTHEYGEPVHLGVFPVREDILLKMREKLNVTAPLLTMN